MTSFDSYGLDPAILDALTGMGFKEASPIQAATLPLILEGKDLVALAETGSGKTAACAIPLCQRVDVKKKHIQILIIVPTRELAFQYATEAQKIGKKRGVATYAVVGGADLSLQLAKLRHGVHMVVATPGRLIDLICGQHLDLSKVQTLVLDEADEMLSMGFIDDLTFIIECLVHPHQTLLFSATMPVPILQLAQKHMKQPEEVRLNDSQTVPKSLSHLFAFCRNRQEKLMRLLTLLEETDPQQALIFCHTRHTVEEVARTLKGKLPGVDFLHGGLSQGARTHLTNRFRRGNRNVRFLVVTDIAARGLDFSGVTHVFLYQLGRDVESYIHRSGRTGRSGRKGTACTLVGTGELGMVRTICNKMECEPEWIGEPPPLEPRKGQKRNMAARSSRRPSSSFRKGEKRKGSSSFSRKPRPASSLSSSKRGQRRQGRVRSVSNETD